MKTLIDELKQIRDFRSGHGRRYPLWLVLLLVLLGYMAGYRGYRPLQEFVQRHHQSLCERLELKDQTFPSFSTFRRILQGLDFHELSDLFERWMASQAAQSDPIADGEAFSIDGKRIRQGIDSDDGHQRFVGLVSVFAHQQGIVLQLKALTETDNSELKVVELLLETLNLQGAILTMDALHAQKNAAVSA